MSKISPKYLEIITETAVKTALEHIEKQKKEQEKKKRDRRLRNIKLLLRNYRSFVKHVEDIKLDIKELDEKLEFLEAGDSEEFSIRTIKKSKEKTLILIRYIEKMLRVYKFMCEESGNPEDLRRYQIIHDLYISEEKLSAKEIAECQNVNLRTVYRDINKACETLSVLVFGVDGIKLS